MSSVSSESLEPAIPPLCATCQAIPIEIFRPLSRSVGIDVPPTLDDSFYQHYSGSDALMVISRSSRQGCPLCAILCHSLEASRQSLPGSGQTPMLPIRLSTETGITLHSFGDEHFIVRDSTHWSLVRFSEGKHINEKGFLLHDNANDKGVFNLIKDWISQCTEHHHSCTIFQLNAAPGYAPARLVSIRRDEDEEQLCLSLIEPDGNGFCEDYVALSHCWGRNPELVPRTTIANINSRMHDIPWHDLTKTFQDAMETTFKLGKSYIWIDSLCIVQDDPRDLEVHCESMSQIYSNSFCTISATGAIDGTEGCFIPRSNAEMRPCVISPAIPPVVEDPVWGSREASPIPDLDNPQGKAVQELVDMGFRTEQAAIALATTESGLDVQAALEYIFNQEHSEVKKKSPDHIEERKTGSDSPPQVFTVLPTFREWTDSMRGPLLSRGWTLQERELSVRVLHFTSDRVVWECREHYASEDDPALKAKSMLFDVGLKFRLLDGNPRDRKNRPGGYKFSKWIELVEEYSMRKLAIKNDKLRAIAGLADAIKSIQQDDIYLSGIWKRDIETQLLWYATPNHNESNPRKSWPPKPVASGIPSWSWAAYDGPILFQKSKSNEMRLSSVNIQKANPSQITLSGVAFRVPFSELQCHSLEMGKSQKYYKWSQPSLGYQIYITLDGDPENPPELELLCLVFAHHHADLEESSTGLPAYTQSSSTTNTENIPRQIWPVDRSVIGLVLLPEHNMNSMHGQSDSRAHSSFARRVGIFNSTGSLPNTKVQVNII